MTYEEEVEAQHQRRVDRLRSETGWLSLVDKIFIGRGDQDIRLPDGTVIGPVLETDGRIELGGKVLRADAKGPTERLVVSGFAIEPTTHLGSLLFRIRDVRELPRPFAGISRFPVDVAWRKEARFEPHETPRVMDLDFDGPTAEGGLTDKFIAPGCIVFEHDGAEHRLEALWSGADETRLFILFRDGTSGSESYPLGRILYADAPKDGRVVVDFNLAILPGCAFSVYATCPIPPDCNKTKLPIRAGERFYEGKAVGEP